MVRQNSSVNLFGDGVLFVKTFISASTVFLINDLLKCFKLSSFNFERSYCFRICSFFLIFQCFRIQIFKASSKDLLDYIYICYNMNILSFQILLFVSFLSFGQFGQLFLTYFYDFFKFSIDSILYTYACLCHIRSQQSLLQIIFLILHLVFLDFSVLGFGNWKNKIFWKSDVALFLMLEPSMYVCVCSTHK